MSRAGTGLTTPRGRERRGTDLRLRENGPQSNPSHLITSPTTKQESRQSLGAFRLLKFTWELHPRRHPEASSGAAAASEVSLKACQVYPARITRSELSKFSRILQCHRCFSVMTELTLVNCGMRSNGQNRRIFGGGIYNGTVEPLCPRQRYAVQYLRSALLHKSGAEPRDDSDSTLGAINTWISGVGLIFQAAAYGGRAVRPNDAGPHVYHRDHAKQGFCSQAHVAFVDALNVLLTVRLDAQALRPLYTACNLSRGSAWETNFLGAVGSPGPQDGFADGKARLPAVSRGGFCHVSAGNCTKLTAVALSRAVPYYGRNFTKLPYRSRIRTVRGSHSPYRIRTLSSGPSRGATTNASSLLRPRSIEEDGAILLTGLSFFASIAQSIACYDGYTGGKNQCMQNTSASNTCAPQVVTGQTKPTVSQFNNCYLLDKVSSFNSRMALSHIEAGDLRHFVASI
ncbi:hypothetical protein B0H19DRAFT_1059812 [Mycena capillaripes]|nr:hypothetical protein B0H19DRAFT_1059812 [Mycena capillaripes]